MPAPTDPATRAAILASIREQTHSCRAIAAQHGVSASTVSKIARDTGIADPFGRARTQVASRARDVDTKARQADMAARRADLADQLLTDAERIRARAWQRYVVVVATKDGADTVELDLPPLADVRQAMTAVGIAIDKHIGLIKHDAGSDLDQAKSMLGDLMAGLAQLAPHLPDDPGPEPAAPPPPAPGGGDGGH